MAAGEMRRSDDAGGAATVDADSARGGAGMKDDGRGRSPDASQAATGPVSGEMRSRGRRVRVGVVLAAVGAFAGFRATEVFTGFATIGVLAGFAAIGAFTAFAGGGATSIGFFGGSGFFAVSTFGLATDFPAFGAGFFASVLRRGAAFFFAGAGATT